MKRGATRIPEPIEFKLPKPPKWLGRLLLAVIIMTAVVSSAWWAVTQIRWQVSDARVLTPLVHGNQQAIDDVLQTFVGQSLFDLRLAKIKQAVEQDPWVYSASVQLLWPTTVEVSIVEQQPVARWNENYLISSRAQVFGPVPEKLNLPLLEGPQASAERVVAEYLTFRQLFEPLSLGIRRLELAKRGAWTVQLDNGLVVYLGANNTTARMQRVKRWWQVAGNSEKSVEYIDARYDNGLAIAMRATEEGK